MITIWIALGLMLVAGLLLGLAIAMKPEVADVNHDGKLDEADAKFVFDKVADVNKDGKVDQADLDIAKDKLKDAAKIVNAVVGANKK